MLKKLDLINSYHYFGFHQFLTLRKHTFKLLDQTYIACVCVCVCVFEKGHNRPTKCAPEKALIRRFLDISLIRGYVKRIFMEFLDD